MSTFCHGIASCQALDKSGEIVQISGLDITSLSKTGIVNFEHKSDVPGQICGKILTAKKIFTKEDCSGENESYFWNKCKVPFVYITAELLDDYCQSGKDAAGLFRYDHDKKDQNSHAILGFSVEGSEIPNTRKGMLITRSIARKVTLTSSPCNSLCTAELLENSPKSQVKDDFEELFRSDQEAITLFKSGEGVKIYEQFLAKKEHDSDDHKGTSLGKTKSGKQIFSHGDIHDYDFNPSEHKEAAEHHRHAAVTSEDADLADHHIERMKDHNSAAVGVDLQKAQVPGSKYKPKEKNPTGKPQYTAGVPKFGPINKPKPKPLKKSESSGWSPGKVDKSKGAVHFNHPEHGTVSIQKQPSGEFHVKHRGALAGIEGVKGSFSSPKEANKHAHKYMRAVSDKKILAPKMHNHPSPEMPKMGKSEKDHLPKMHPNDLKPGKMYDIGHSSGQMGKYHRSTAAAHHFSVGDKSVQVKRGSENDLKKALTAGGMNAAPSTLVNGSAYQSESLGSKQATTGAEEHSFKGTKKKDWNAEAKSGYENWPQRAKFEAFMKARMPHLHEGEIKALGRAISLKKALDMEKALSDLVDKKKK